MSFRRAASCIQLLTVALLFSSAVLAQNTTNDTQPKVVIRTSMGDMVVELDAERAPGTVKNFLTYVDDNFYADTVFHRVIEGFMIQGGGFTTDFQRKATRSPVSNEAYNGLRNNRYTIAMARTTAPHSATSQFFINSESNSNLNHTSTTQRGWGYTVFGRVVQGKDIVDAISQVKTSAGGPFGRDVPNEPIVILGVDRVLSLPPEAKESGNAAAQPDKSMEDSIIAAPKDAII